MSISLHTQLLLSIGPGVSQHLKQAWRDEALSLAIELLMEKQAGPTLSPDRHQGRITLDSKLSGSQQDLIGLLSQTLAVTSGQTQAVSP